MSLATTLISDHNKQTKQQDLVNTHSPSKWTKEYLRK